MNDEVKKASQAGYTLVETLVAMSIFLSVVIPIGAGVANMVLHNDSTLIQQALHRAQTEVVRISENPEEGEQSNVSGRLLVSSEVKRNGDLVEVRVNIRPAKDSKRPLVSLHKTLLVRP